MVRELSPERRERFLAAALRLFAANGLRGTSTAEIAREAGAAAGTLFLYFPTKQALIDELVLWITRQEAGVITGLLDPSLPAREAFFTIWDRSIRWLLDNMDAYRFSQQIRDSGMVSADVVREQGKLFSFYYDAVQKGLQEGSIKPYPVDLIGGFLYQGIVAVMNAILSRPDSSSPDELIRQGFDLFWDGIRIRQPGMHEQGG